MPVSRLAPGVRPEHSHIASRVLLITAILIAAALSYVFLDRHVVKWYSDTQPFWTDDANFEAIAQLGKTTVTLWLVVIVAWIMRRPRLLVAASLAMILIACVVLPTKYAVGRYRPTVTEATASHDYGGTPDFGFPSGDSATALGAAVVLAYHFRKRRYKAAVYAMACGVAALRVLCLKHYFSDVLVGSAVGLVCGWAALRLGDKLTVRLPKFGRRALFALALALPLTDVAVGGVPICEFLEAVGPVLGVVILLSQGRIWFRWLNAAKDLAPLERRKRIRNAVVLLALIGSIILLPSLNWTTLFDRDEGYYAECAREMAVGGSLTVPHFSGAPWMEKPPLTFWAMAASMKFFGMSEFAARLPSGLAAIAAICLTFYLGYRMFSPSAGLAGAIVLGSSLLFGFVGRLALLDSTLLACTMISMIGLWGIIEGIGRWNLVLFYFGCGMGALAKGPLGIALPFIALAGYLVFSGNWALLRRMKLIRGSLVVAIIFGLWLVPAAIATDGRFIRELIWVHSIAPWYNDVQGHGAKNLPMYFLELPSYLPMLVLGLLPWTLLLPAGLNYLVRKLGWRDNKTAFLVGWAAAQLLVFSLVSTKLPHYMMPLLPPLAIICGFVMAQYLWGERPLPVGRFWLMLCVIIPAAGIAAVPFFAHSGYLWPFFIPAAGAFFVAAASTVRNSNPRARIAVFIVLVTALSLGQGWFWQFGMHQMDSNKAPWRIAEFLKHRYGKQGMKTLDVGIYRYRDVSLVFYLRKSAKALRDAAELRDFLASPNTVAVMPESALRIAEKELALPIAVIWRQQVWSSQSTHWDAMTVVAKEGAVANQSSSVTPRLPARTSPIIHAAWPIRRSS